MMASATARLPRWTAPSPCVSGKPEPCYSGAVWHKDEDDDLRPVSQRAKIIGWTILVLFVLLSAWAYAATGGADMPIPKS